MFDILIFVFCRQISERDILLWRWCESIVQFGRLFIVCVRLYLCEVATVNFVSVSYFWVFTGLLLCSASYWGSLWNHFVKLTVRFVFYKSLWVVYKTTLSGLLYSFSCFSGFSRDFILLYYFVLPWHKLFVQFFVDRFPCCIACFSLVFDSYAIIGHIASSCCVF